MNVPAKYRTIIYWLVLVMTVALGVLSALGLVPEDAVSRGATAVTEIVTVIGAVLALLNVAPDE